MIFNNCLKNEVLSFYFITFKTQNSFVYCFKNECKCFLIFHIYTEAASTLSMFTLDAEFLSPTIGNNLVMKKKPQRQLFSHRSLTRLV